MVNKIVEGKDVIFKNFHGMFALVNYIASVIYNNKNEDENTNWFFDLTDNTVYFDESIEYTKNVWQYYFEQPCKTNLEKINHSLPTSSYKLMSLGWVNWTVQYHKGHLQKELLQSISDFIFKIGKNKIVLKESLIELIEQTKKNLGLENGEFISVHYRDYDVTHQEHHGHIAGRPEIDTWFNTIDSLQCENLPIFLSTDSHVIITDFKKKYGDRLKCVENIDRSYMKSYKNIINDSLIEEQSPYFHGLNAIVDSYILSYGKKIVRQCSGLSFFSILLNPNIEVINIDK